MSNFYVILVIIRLTVATNGHLFEERRITKGWEDCKKQIEELKKGKDAAVTGTAAGSKLYAYCEEINTKHMEMIK